MQTDTSEATPSQRANVRTLNEIRLGIGETIQLQFQGGAEAARCFVTLIGYLEG